MRLHTLISPARKPPGVPLHLNIYQTIKAEQTRFNARRKVKITLPPITLTKDPSP